MNAPLNPALIQAVCFDLDGTLVNTDDRMVSDLARALRPLSYLLKDGDATQLARRVVMSMETPANALYALLDRLHIDELISPLGEALHTLRRREKPEVGLLIPGVREMLQALSEDYPLAVVTARGHHSTHTFLEASGLADHFQVVVTARTTLRAKPHPAPIRHAAKHMGVPVEGCLMVGDTVHDVRAAIAAGSQAIGVLCGFGLREELESAGANLILGHTPQLVELLGAGGDGA